jgi:tetratricopeptide (TPR) repeat protein
VSGTQRRRLACLVAGTAWLLAACSSPEARFARHVERGEALAAQNRFVEAVLELRNALEIEPRNAELHDRIGDLLISQRAYKEAASYYRQAFALDPKRLDSALAEARLVSFVDPDRAKQLVALALERAPDDAEVQRTRAKVALARSDVAEALRAAQRAVELERDSAESWLELGAAQQALIRVRQLAGLRAGPEVFQAAIDAFAEVDRLRGGDTWAQVQRARVFAAWAGHREEAIAMFRAAIENAKRRDDAQGRLVAAKAFDDFARAERNVPLRQESLREVVEADEQDFRAWDELMIHSELGSVPRGEEVCRELVAKRPEDPRAHRVYARYFTRKKQPAKTVAYLRGVIEGGVDSPLLWEELVNVHITGNQLADARAGFLEMSKRFPGDPVTRGIEARLALAEGRPADAAPILRELMKQRESVEGQRMLAMAEQRLGNLTEAVHAIDRAVALTTPKADLYRLKARIHFDAKQWASVIVAYRTVEGLGRRLSPRDALRRAIALYGYGRPDLGRLALEELLSAPDFPADVAIEYAHREGSARFETAQGVLLEALSRSPGDPDLLEALAKLEGAAGRREQTLARLDAEIAAGRAVPRTLLLRARLLIAQGALDRAEADALRAFEAAPLLPGTADLLIEIYRRQGRLAEAQRSFEEAEAAGVLHVGARLLLARLQVGAGELEKGQQTLEKVVAEQPELPGPRNDLAYVLAARGEQLDRALELARSVQQAMSGQPAAVDTLGYVHYQAGRFEEALAELRRAVALAEAQPGNPPPIYSYHLGLALEALGRKQEAAGAFRRALASRQEFPEAEDARRRLEAALATSPAGANAS